ncbi:CYP2U1 [Branchiostoma lanceolatum]|uniref:Cytochrome P450 2U1 n=1 Tax=Branchiostoma lanceolatum TaxID=7740 RepID=A0A8K0A094_BRALA|nr:CYP2U1 [Branchiostoma lanceolatum]
MNSCAVVLDAPVLVFTDWSKTYGDVFTVYFGPRRTIVLNGYAAIHEALVKNAEDFSSRTQDQASFVPDGKTLGIVREPYGPKWKEHRKFALMSLRDFGVGKRSMEGKILEEARALGDEIYAKDNRAFCVSHMMQNAVSNVICSIVFGCRYEYDDMEFKVLLKAINCIFSRNVGVTILTQLFPPTRFLPGARKQYQELKQNQGKLMDHIKKRIKEHEETFDSNDIRDFIDAFLMESKKRHGDDNSNFSEQEHATIVYQLFLAGTDTTSTTLRWALLYMILHPDIQGKVQQEIDSVMGPNQEPSMVHRSQMPYTEATLTEVLRLAPVAPLTIPHGTSNDTVFRGYNIPKETSVTVNIWSVHRDPNLWPGPDKFDPTRFLDDSGKYVRRDEVIPFSIGRRVCLGEQLARMEIFLIFTSLLQRFTFKLPEGAPKPSEEGVHGATYQPKPFMLMAEPKE